MDEINSQWHGSASQWRSVELDGARMVHDFCTHRAQLATSVVANGKEYLLQDTARVQTPW